jgi:Domain of unknown function (DUF2935)
LIEQCQILSLINPLLADHVTREANKFLSILNVLGNRAQNVSISED